MKHWKTRAALLAPALAASALALAQSATTQPSSPAGTSTATPTPGMSNQPGTSDSQGMGSAAQGDTTPVIIVVPSVFALDPNLSQGCWARLYDKTNLRGNVLTLTGPVEIANGKPATITGYEMGRNFDSVAVGPKASLMVWDQENFQNKTTTFKAGQVINNLDNRMGNFEEIRSLKVNCSQ